MKHIATCNTLSDLKALSTVDGDLVFVLGATTQSDGLGGFYMFSASSTASVDNTFYNVVASTTTTTGRWTRVFQRVMQLPQGTLTINGGFKTFYASTTTTSSGNASLNMTLDGTTTGTPIFTKLMFNSSEAAGPAATPTAAVSSYVQSITTDLRTTTHGYYKGNAVSITLGLLYQPFTAVAAGTQVNFRVEGV